MDEIAIPYNMLITIISIFISGGDLCKAYY